MKHNNNSVEMDDEFELQFADELDVIADLDSDYQTGPAPKGKKSLDFSTPASKSKDKGNKCNPRELLDESLCVEPLNRSHEEVPFEKKRKASEETHADFEIDLQNIEPKRKKAKLLQFEGLYKSNTSLEVSPERQAGKSDEQRLAEYDFVKPRVFTRIPTRDYVPVTDNNGERFYLNLYDEDELNEEVTDIIAEYRPSQLLAQPLNYMKRKIEEKKFSNVVEESKKLSQAVMWDTEEAPAVNVTDKASSKKLLWVDKYSPVRYTELLSDEATNRVVLKWLKLWDCVVFNKERKAKAPAESKSHKEQKFVPINKNRQELTDELDDLDRPLYKAVLLSGPPGLGKTTLAHVISNHAGYNVVEINASDDRSAEIFKQKVEAATQMKSVIGADPRPNCLVIDEIDGAPVAAVNILLALLKQTENSAGSTKRKKKPQVLLRPIICICNDLYVPALRQLRQVAMVVNFPPTIGTHLAGRLLEVCRREKLQTDLTTLLALCEKAENDIRSCLNTLQFVKGEGRELIMHTVNSLSLGQKDAQKSLFATWQHIFRMPKPKRKQYVNPYDRAENPTENITTVVQNSNISLQSRFESALEVTIAAGETEKIIEGLFENYLDAKVKDPRLNMVVKATEWLEYVDIMTQDVYRSQNYILMRYISYLPVMFHLLFASSAPHKIMFPHSQNEYNSKLTKSKHLMDTLMADVCPAVKKNLNVTIIVTEFMHSVLEVLQPTMRPVNTQLYSAREKQELAHLIQVMIAYNISYRQERTPDGQYTYVLDPNIDELNKFPEMKPRKQLSYAAKQLISREIELEKMRRSETKENSKTRISSVKRETPKDGNICLPNHKRQTLESENTGIQHNEDKEYVDFFGRIVKRTSPSGKTATDQRKEEKIGEEIWFKFKEGFSNAVRRTVRVSDFL